MSRARKTSRESLSIDGLDIELIRSSKRRTLTLEVGHQGIRARAPWRMPHSDIQSFIRSKHAWLRRHLQALPERPAELKLQDGAQLLLHGRPMTLRLHSGRAAVSISQQNEIMVPVSKSHLPLEQTVHRKLVKWYKTTAMTILSKRVMENANTMLPGKAVPMLKVRDYRRRWGSCDHRGQLAFNWRIILAPPEVQNYVVVHELAHITEFNHSRKFWQLVAARDPNWKENQLWLEQHGQLLYRF